MQSVPIKKHENSTQIRISQTEEVEFRNREQIYLNVIVRSLVLQFDDYVSIVYHIVYGTN